MMNAIDFKNKVILVMYPEEQVAIAGLVLDHVGEDILYLQAQGLDKDMAASYFLLSLEYLACNPDTVQIFDNLEVFEKDNERREKKKDAACNIVALPKKK